MNEVMQDLLLNDRDVDTPTVVVSALDTLVVEDGDPMDAEHIRSEVQACYCSDGRHRHADREQIVDGRMPETAHPVPVHLYTVVGERP